jgi:UDP-glucose 4-epimerase
MSTYLVTGATGLTGHYVLRELVERGASKEEIVAYEVDPNRENVSDIADDITLVEGDVTDRIELLSAFEEHRPEYVIHLATINAERSWDDLDGTIAVNCTGTNNVFHASRLFDVERTVYASTCGVYGNADDFPWKSEPVTVSEADPIATTHPYSASKYLTEVMGRSFSEKYDVDLLGVRIAGVWGRGRYSSITGALNRMVRDVALGEPAEIPHSLYVRDGINYAYGKDAGRWLVDVCHSEAATDAIYNMGTAEPYDMDDMKRVLERIEPDARIAPPDDPAAWEQGAQTPIVDCSKWYDELGFEQRWSLEEAVADCVEHHRSRAR